MSDIIDKVSLNSTTQMAMLKEELGAGMRRERDSDGKTAMVLSYVRAHAGEHISLEQLAEAAGWSGGPSASPAIRKLVQRGVLIRKRLKHAGQGHHFTYYPGTLTGAPRKNGPASSNYFEAVEPGQKKQKRLDEINTLEAESWGYLKAEAKKLDAESTGRVVQAVMGYFDYLREQVDGD